jgi:hypothetical protein
LAYCPRSSLPAKVLTWLAARLAHPLPSRPPRDRRHPAAVAGGPPGRGRRGAAGRAVVPGAGQMVGISKTEVGDSLDLLLGPLAALGY